MYVRSSTSPQARQRKVVRTLVQVSQEVIRSSAGDVWISQSRRWIKNDNILVEGIVHLKNRRAISTAVTIVRCREDSDHTFVVMPAESFHHQLVGADDESQAIGGIELLSNVLTKGVPSTTGRNPPPLSLFWITPKQVADRAVVRNFLHSLQLGDLIQCVEGWRQSAVWAKDLQPWVCE